MIYHLVITILLGVAVAGFLMLARKVVGDRLPTYLIPAAAGAAMIAYNVWHEYTWHERTIARLPASIHVLGKFAQPAPFRPWSYVVPSVSRILFIDTSRMLRNPNAAHLVLFEFLEVERLQPTKLRRVLYDCTDKRVADVPENTEFKRDGLPSNLTWAPLDLGSEKLGLICKSTGAPKPAL